MRCERDEIATLLLSEEGRNKFHYYMCLLLMQKLFKNELPHLFAALRNGETVWERRPFYEAMMAPEFWAVVDYMASQGMMSRQAVCEALYDSVRLAPPSGVHLHPWMHQNGTWSDHPDMVADVQWEFETYENKHSDP